MTEREGALNVGVGAGVGRVVGARESFLLCQQSIAEDERGMCHRAEESDRVN